MTFKPYNVRTRHSYKALHHDMELHKDLLVECEKTMALLHSLRDVVIRFKSTQASYILLREHEMMNNELEEVWERYKGDINEADRVQVGVAR